MSTGKWNLIRQFVCHSTSWTARFAAGVALVVSLSPCLATAFQDDAAAVQEEGEESSDDFMELIEQWNEMEAKLAQQELMLESNASDPVLEATYAELVDEANGLVDTMRAAAPAGLMQYAGDVKVIKTVLGIMVNDARYQSDWEVLELGDAMIAANVNPAVYEIARGAADLPIESRRIFDELSIRSNEAASDLPVVKMTTTQGDISIQLFEDEAPNTVANFVNLVESGYYNGIEFHRVREGFMAQSGCPEGTGQGGPGYTIKCECRGPGYRRHFTGVISMANTGLPDTGGSQFFLTFEQTSGLDGLHTVFGRIIEGRDVLDKLTRTHTAPTQPGGPEPEIPGVVKDKIISAEIVTKRDHEYVPETIGGEPVSSGSGDAAGEDNGTDDEAGDGNSDEDSGAENSDGDEGGEN